MGAQVGQAPACVRALCAHPAPPRPPERALQFLSSDGVQLTGGSTYRMDWRAPPPSNPLAFWAVQVIDLDDIAYPNADAPFVTGEDTWLEINGKWGRGRPAPRSRRGRCRGAGAHRVQRASAPARPPASAPAPLRSGHACQATACAPLLPAHPECAAGYVEGASVVSLKASVREDGSFSVV